MLKNKIKKFFLSKKDIFKDKKFKIFGRKLYDPCVWYFNKYTISRGVSVGLFCAWIPIPLQMILAASFAIFFKANILVSVALVWITNPITMPILFLFAYKVGMIFFTVIVTENIDFQLSFAWLFNKMYYIWQPFILGCFICAIVSSIVGNLVLRILWRFFIVRTWYSRKNIKR